MKKASLTCLAGIIGIAIILVFLRLICAPHPLPLRILLWFNGTLVLAEFIFANLSNKTVLLTSSGLVAGLFVGTLFGLPILYPDRANLFPIMAVFFSIGGCVPVGAGALVGRWLGSRTAQKKGNQP